jgi:uncharacterized protein with GYD domain
VPTYLLLSTLTPEGRRALHRKPYRLEEVNEEIAAFGCTVVAQYAVLGQYDFVTIVDAPDNETVAHLVLDLGSRGTVAITPLAAMSIPAFRDKLLGHQHLGHD